MATIAFRNSAGPNGPVSLLDNLAEFGAFVGAIQQRIAVWEEDLARPRAILRGGNDQITGTTARSRIIGDVFVVSQEGRVYGGHDVIDLSGVTDLTSLWLSSAAMTVLP